MFELQSLRDKLLTMQKGYERAVKASREADGRMQTRYDTQKEDYARDAEIIQRQMVYLEEAIHELENMTRPTVFSRVSIGHLVSLEIDDDPAEKFLLITGQGGIQIDDFQTLSTESPIGQAIIGKKRADEVTVVVRKQQFEVNIVDIQ